jgi:hypothetical protein
VPLPHGGTSQVLLYHTRRLCDSSPGMSCTLPVVGRGCLQKLRQGVCSSHSEVASVVATLQRRRRSAAVTYVAQIRQQAFRTLCLLTHFTLVAGLHTCIELMCWRPVCRPARSPPDIRMVHRWPILSTPSGAARCLACSLKALEVDIEKQRGTSTMYGQASYCPILAITFCGS